MQTRSGWERAVRLGIDEKWMNVDSAQQLRMTIGV
jgi:hypothetical protein